MRLIIFYVLFIFLNIKKVLLTAHVYKKKWKPYKNNIITIHIVLLLIFLLYYYFGNEDDTP